MCKMGIIPPTTVNDLLFHEEEGSYINLKLLEEYPSTKKLPFDCYFMA